MDAEWRETLSIYGPAVVAEAEALERALSPAQHERVLSLLVAVDEACSDRDHAEHEREWALLQAHVPGLGLALEHVRSHVQGGYLECCHAAGTPQQRLKEEYRRD
jgi:hypothetical protein